MSNKERYKTLCDHQESISIFSQYWWLDAVCGMNNWDVAIVEKGGQIVASMPYYLKKKYSFKFISMPILTQTMGVWYAPSKSNYSKSLSNQKSYIIQILAQLPKISSFNQNFHRSFTNWLPLYWKGFSQTTRYTYIISKSFDLEQTWKSIQSNIRTDIKKAREKFLLNIFESDNIELFLRINEMTFKRQGEPLPYSIEVVKKLNKVLSERYQRKILFAKDNNSNIHAGIYLVWDHDTVYFLMGGGNPKLRTSGATSMLMWEGIQLANSLSKDFDFEGSMLEPVEKFFRAFGAKQYPYYKISKINNPILKAYQLLKG